VTATAALRNPGSERYQITRSQYRRAMRTMRRLENNFFAARKPVTCDRDKTAYRSAHQKSHWQKNIKKIIINHLEYFFAFCSAAV
jgi:phosphohistidine phosphatase SixA